LTDRYRLVNIFLGMLILFKLYQHPFPEDEMDKLSLVEMSEQRQLPWTALFPDYQERLLAMALLTSDLLNRPCKLELLPINKSTTTTRERHEIR